MPAGRSGCMITPESILTATATLVSFVSAKVIRSGTKGTACLISEAVHEVYYRTGTDHHPLERLSV